MFAWLTKPSAAADTAAPPSEAVAVSLKTGSTILGALVGRIDDGLIVRAGTLIGVDRNQNETREPLDGDTIIPYDNIDFWQTGLDPAIVSRLQQE